MPSPAVVFLECLLAAPPFGKGVGCEALSITWNSQGHILKHYFNSQSMRSRSKVCQKKRYLSKSSSTPPPCLQELHLLYIYPQKKLMSKRIPLGLRKLPGPPSHSNQVSTSMFGQFWDQRLACVKQSSQFNCLLPAESLAPRCMRSQSLLIPYCAARIPDHPNSGLIAFLRSLHEILK